MHCAGVPDAPKSVELTESMADGVILTVESPEEDGGMPVIGYRVHYGDDDRHDVTTSGTYRRPLMCCMRMYRYNCSLQLYLYILMQHVRGL